MTPDPAGTPGIELDGVRLDYGDTRALDGVSVRLDGGKIYGLLGRNGAGKSSLLGLLAAFRRPTAGEVRVGGRPVFERPEVVSRICLIRETGDTVDGGEPVGEALAFAARHRPTWDADYAERLVDRFELPLGTHIGKLSRGKQCALGITLGLATRAPLTMFDESYLGMDAPSRYAFYDELLSDYMAHPRTVVVSTHLIEEVSSLFEEVLILDRGRLLVHEQADTLRSRGVTVTGPAGRVDRFVADLGPGATVLGTQELGPTRSTAVYGDLDDGRRAAARTAGLELGPISLQDLFVHLTEPPGTGEATGAGEPAPTPDEPEVAR
jgi:ABC-2 type transport system ATP-binding protein